MRVGDVALRAGDVDPHVNRAAAADLHRIAEPVDRSRLTDQDHFRPNLPLVQPVDDARSPVGGIAFLVARDQQRHRAFALPHTRNGADKCSDRAFHVVGAAPDQNSVLDMRVERVAAPTLAGRNDVEMAGETEMRSAFAADRDHVLGRPVRRLAHHPAVNGKPERLQGLLQEIEHFAARGSHARAVDQVACKRDGVD